MNGRDESAVCPQCGAPREAAAVECLQCGVIFARMRRTTARRNTLPEVYDDRHAGREPIDLEPPVVDGRIGRSELLILGSGLAAAIVVYALPFTRFVFSALVTLFHELGHAVAGWLLGYPSIPAFDFVYGGGLTHHGEFHTSIAFAVAAGLGWLAWTFRRNWRSVAVIASVFVVWLFFVTAEWRRELAFASAGHVFEFVLAGVLFYQAMSGVGWKIPEVERPLGAFAAFFVQIHSMLFAWRLISDRDFLAWYREGKGGALMNDLEVIALDLKIYTPFGPSIEGVAKALLVFSVVPMAIGVLWYVKRSRWHGVMRSLRYEV